MKKLASFTFSLLLAAAAFTSIPARAASTSEMLQQGLYAEEVDGNINAAIKIYGQVIASSSASPNQVAQALYRQGMCYLKIKDEVSARAALEKLVNNYPNQTDLIEKARPVLDELTDFDPAALMPPGTLVYVEFGSPGRQIETILTMLKGTPFENPLAALNGGRQSNPGQKSPGDIVGALLNPSMMAEFKKIRGSAIGVTGFAQNNPPIVSVLYPGRSNALRGLILAGLGMAGSPGEPIEGMQTITFKNADAAAAYDDTVIIVCSHPASQLEWCVKQYKHTGSGPTLASSRGSFQKLDKNQRQKNAITIWADAGAVYGGLVKMLPQDNMPPQILKANALFDFANIDDLIVTESIESNRLGLQAGLQFKEGHSCLAYDLVRTPNLSKAALQAVPADAIALASFSLSQTDAAQSDKVRAQIQTLTGLDVGREIFANIEQVTIFAMPGDGNVPASSRAQALMSRIGIAITSRNPAQTRQLLTTVLGTLNAGQGESTPGRFKIPFNNAQDVYCYLEQADNVTILSLNHDVAAAAASAIERHASVCDSGTLHDAVDRIAPSTSKLLLVNVGGAMRLIGPLADVRSLSADDARKLSESFDQIAAAASSTTLQVRTDEQHDSFTLNSEIAGIPPLSEIIGPATQYQGLRSHARAATEARELRQQSAATISPTPRPPHLGAGDSCWSSAKPYKLENVVIPSPNGTHATAEYGGLWDANNLYLLVDVTDSTPHHNKGLDPWLTDGVEVYLDATGAKPAEYGDADYQYIFVWDKSAPEIQERKHDRTNNVRYAMVATDKGYRLEIAFPWSTLGAKPAAGARIGLDVHVNDSQSDGKRDAKISWHDQEDNAWENPRNFGNAELAGLVGWWKFDETQGTSARDSSGGNHDGTLIGHATWGKGRIGGAVALDGAGSYVKIADSSAFDFSGELTVAAWVNIHSVSSEWMAIITKGDSAWRMSTVKTDDKIHFSVNHYDRTDGVNGATDLTLNEWHHVAAVYDGNTLRIFVDGKLDSTQPWTGGIASNDADVLIGNNSDHTDRGFDGLIDDVRVYDYALSEGEIKGLATGQ